MPFLGFILPASDDERCRPHTPAFVTATTWETGLEAVEKAAILVGWITLDLIRHPEKLAEIKAEHERILAQL